MQTSEAYTAAIAKRHSASSKATPRPADKRSNHEPLMTSALTTLGSVLGTAALVGIHHHYRKQHQPEARLQDYVSGVRAQLHTLQASPKPQLTRLRYAYQQASAAWQRAYHDDIDDKNRDSKNIVTELTAIHSTIMLARPVCWVSGVASMPQNRSLINNDDSNDDSSNDETGFGVVGIDADRQIVWQTTMPERVHDIVVQPIPNIQNRQNDQNKSNTHNCPRDVVVLGRRPSEKFWVLDTAIGQVKFAITAADNRHFYGHACYSLDGSTLYVTENDTISLAGKIGIYDARNNYSKVAEFDTHGIGPHELIMHPDGETLVIANGGIKTEQASREELNLDTMRPSLAYLNRHDGTLIEQITPEHNQMSVRHLGIHDDGTVMIGIQFQGEKHINVPLVLTHYRGDPDFKPLIMPSNQWQRFHQYIASVAVDSERNLLCVTTPIGGCAAIYDLNTRMLIDAVRLPDCAGASLFAGQVSGQAKNKDGTSGFIVSDGHGKLTRLWVNTLSVETSDLAELDSKNTAAIIVQDSQIHNMSFDNHLQAVLA
ncbi:DUF1513 domain-containing protein [Psychrobacter immobilis]|uniref:DUF1513 domain-containing protein n=1 Tax=Psychrobacter immobilis TaxID=498 RepID=UPI001917F9EF|nr:DUF1513 domain-containing protein [Psychrobacter immobilis]